MKTEDPEERAFVERLRAAYSPPPLTSFDAARFDARLRERIARSTRRRQWAIGGAVLAAAAAILLLVPDLFGGAAPAPEVDWLTAMAEPAEADWIADPALPADPLAVPALDLTLVEASAATEEAEETEETPADAPEWMPAEYATLAALIDVDPYAPEEEWP